MQVDLRQAKRTGLFRKNVTLDKEMHAPVLKEFTDGPQRCARRAAGTDEGVGARPPEPLQSVVLLPQRRKAGNATDVDMRAGWLLHKFRVEAEEQPHVALEFLHGMADKAVGTIRANDL